MNLTQNLVLVAIIALFAVLEVASGRHKDFHATADDTKLEAFMFIALIALSQPLIFKVSGLLSSWLMADQKGAWAALPWWAMTAILLVGDDLTQYLWHRASHTPLLWPLHRAHHSAHYMSIRITYRNNFFYYLMMPGLWISGVLIYLGFGTVYLVYIVVKLAVILGAGGSARSAAYALMKRGLRVALVNRIDHEDKRHALRHRNLCGLEVMIFYSEPTIARFDTEQCATRP